MVTYKLLGKTLKDILTSTEALFRIIRGIDYKTLSEYILNINQLQHIDGIMGELSRCLRELVDYQLFGFAIRHDGTLDVWIDPRVYDEAFFSMLRKDFPSHNFDANLHYLPQTNQSYDSVFTAGGNGFLSYTVMDASCRAILYVLPGKKLFAYHEKIIRVILKTIAVALTNSLTIKSLENMAAIDSLTGCYNTRALKNCLERVLASSDRYGGDVSVIMFDLDEFKSINDRHGHPAGDAVLKEVARRVQAAIRKSDYFARYGGDEFVIILPNTRFSIAADLAERLRKIVSSFSISLTHEQINVTASFGVTQAWSGIDGGTLLNEADKMLYRSKSLGRNIVSPSPNRTMFQQSVA